VPEILDRLRAEHRDLACLLAVIARQSQQLHREGRADCGLLQQIVAYLGNYPELVHHPREDVLYVCLLARSPNLDGVIADIRDQHVELGRQTEALAQAVARAASGTSDAVSALAEMCASYLAAYRQHLETEETVLFPLAERDLTAGDWEVCADAVSPASDPLFGAEVGVQYHALLDSIKRSGA